MPEIPWYQLEAEEILDHLKTRLNGLNQEEVTERQLVYKNTLDTLESSSPWLMFINQFTDTMVLVLLGATVVSGAIGAMADAVTIMAIVVVNAVLGFIQEYRAERSLEAIKKMTSPQAVVIRNNQRQTITADHLVPGDLVCLEAGDRIPADVRFIEAVNMEIEEAALTGESVPVEKTTAAIEHETPLAEQHNLGFMGTSITRGRGMAVVIRTGMNTEMGKIAALIKQTESAQTPLQRKLDQLGKSLILICIAVCTIVTLMGIARGEPVITMLMAGISLAVAAIPEGLPAVVTIVLALGVQRMSERNAIVRKLPAVETLGCTTAICSDKTGTLTQNKMMVTRLAAAGHEVFIEMIPGKKPEAVLKKGDRNIKPLHHQDLQRIMQISIDCNNARLEADQEDMVIKGDPTEAALYQMAWQAGIRQASKRVRELPFDSVRKRMSVIVETDGHYLVYTKGALDQLLPLCTRAEGKGNPPNNKEYIINKQEEWARQALRVLGFAYRPISKTDAYNMPDELIESQLTLTGVCGIIDPPRTGVADSVRLCRQAGIIPVMITGDHPSTALAIGRDIGLTDSHEVVTGMQMDRMTDEELYRSTVKNRVFARVTPQHKNRIVKVLQQHKHVVAMTGDGVNDAPAIKAADIGIAMGISGTEVTKEASSMILADDDFSTIVSAVYEGRAIYENIRKFIRYLLGCNIGEVLVMFMASLLGMPLPLMPIQILWVNLVTDGLPAMALGLEPPEPGIMNRKPRPVGEGVFARGLGWTILGRGVYIAVITLLAFTMGLLYFRIQGNSDLSLARTMALTTLVCAQLFYVFECRSEAFSPFELGFFSNRFLVIAVGASVIMQLSVIYLPFLQDIFKTVGLNWWQWVLVLSMAGAKLIWKYILYTWFRFFISSGRYVTMGAK